MNTLDKNGEDLQNEDAQIAKIVQEVQKSQEVKMAQEAQREQEAQRAKEAQRAQEAKEAHKAHKAPKTPEAQEAQEIPEAQEASKAPETQEAQEAQEAPKAQEEAPPPEKPRIIVTIGSGALSALIELRRSTSAETLNPEKEDIMAALKEKGVVSCIDEDYIEQFCKDPAYDTPAEVARGKAAQNGKNGEVKYLVAKKREMRPTIGPDGLADYRDLGLVSNVSNGQPLCEIIPPTKGENGITVYGAVLESLKGRDAVVPVGKNTKYDEQRRIVIAEVDGNVEVASNGVINVHDVLTIKGSVDISTGDIDFVGDVIIGGDVASGFKVISKGDITIKGIVEGATLTAVGNITIGGSVHGTGTARITAGKNVTCKNMQYCNIVSGEDIYADSMIYCVIQCGGNLELSGKHGTLIGGRSVIAKVLDVRSIGTQSQVATVVSMAGGGLMFTEKIGTLKNDIAALEKEMVTHVQAITLCQELIKSRRELKTMQLTAYENAKMRLPQARVELDNKKKELEEAQQAIEQIKPEDTYITCSGPIHPGVKLVFGAQAMNIQTQVVNSRIYLADGEITFGSM